jgi:hypothetical protein
MPGNRLRIHPDQWPENQHHLPSALSITGAQGRIQFLVLVSKTVFAY